MLFDWDAGNVKHIARHGITPEECEEAYRNGPMVIERTGRIRFVTAYPMDPSQRRIYRGEGE